VSTGELLRRLVAPAVVGQGVHRTSR
jgi:hypothetical protein